MSIESYLRQLKAERKVAETLLSSAAAEKYRVNTEIKKLAEEYADVEEAWVPEVWDCEDPVNKFGTCIYDMSEPPFDDACVFCGDPYERK